MSQITKRKERQEPVIPEEEHKRAIQLMAEKINNISEPTIIVLTGAGLSTSAGRYCKIYRIDYCRYP